MQCKLGIGIGAPHDARKIDCLHGCDRGRVAVGIGHWRDVCHDEFSHESGIFDRQDHGSFAAHGMTEDISLAAEVADHACQIIGKRGIGMIGIPKTVAVVAQVNGDHPALGRKPFCNCAPVACRAKQTMRYDQRRGIGLTFKNQIGKRFRHAVPPRKSRRNVRVSFG